MNLIPGENTNTPSSQNNNNMTKADREEIKRVRTKIQQVSSLFLLKNRIIKLLSPYWLVESWKTKVGYIDGRLNLLTLDFAERNMFFLAQLYQHQS